MLTVRDLQPGDVGFTRISGPAGMFVWLAQRLLAVTSWRERKLHHVFIVTEVLPTMTFRIVQAVPGGAEEVLVGEDHLTKHFTYLRPQYQIADSTFALDMPGHPYAIGQAQLVADCARKYKGTPYSFLDYLAILLWHLGVKRNFVRQYVTGSGHMICSQLADQALSDAGVHVFNDKRLPQDVMPVELYRGLRAIGAMVVTC